MMISSSLAIFICISALQQNPPADPADDPVAKGVEVLLGMQSGDGDAEWPYEGVYRVRGQIPIGYRVGGTAIAAQALVAAPGCAEDQRRLAAVEKACTFVCNSRSHPDMNPKYAGGYDVRGWGYCAAIQFLVRLEASHLAPANQIEEIHRAAKDYIAALQAIEIPQRGGWAYARQAIDQPSPAATFMTAMATEVLMEARAAGYDVNADVVDRALNVLELSRTASGAIVYSAQGDSTNSREPVPGAVGRMLAAETVLLLSGRSDAAKVRGAVDAFFTHWEWLEKRRKQQGTHVPPYQIAPYYFYFAHGWAAEAVELLPRHERAEYRRRLREILLRTRDADGSWNDRVFDRSRAYGTAVVITALGAPDRGPLPSWSDPAKPGDQPTNSAGLVPDQRTTPSISNTSPASSP